MSETTVTPRHPANALLALVITLLTPMFLAVAEGNLAFARQAATETLNAYRAETGSDLITVAKIIGFGLAALAALSLSMAEDLPISTLLRLHASASAADRSEHRNRQALKQSQIHRPPTAPEPNIDEAALTAAAEAMKALTAENLAGFATPKPVPAPRVAPASSASTPPTVSVTDEERRYQATWAASAAAVAAETAASLPTLSPQERHSAAIWIEVLNQSAKEFMAGDIVPSPRPADFPG
jgi:hypothetical protein